VSGNRCQFSQRSRSLAGHGRQDENGAGEGDVAGSGHLLPVAGVLDLPRILQGATVNQRGKISHADLVARDEVADGVTHCGGSDVAVGCQEVQSLLRGQCAALHHGFDRARHQVRGKQGSHLRIAHSLRDLAVERSRPVGRGDQRQQLRRVRRMQMP